jgi:type I restriction-modification system DNA methylase subunit
MVDPTDVHVSLAEIARIAGVGRAAVSNWRRRHDTFPAPVGGSDTSPQFSLAEVEQWLRHHGKGEAVGSRERLWLQFEALGDRTLAGLAIAEVARRVLPGHAIMPMPARDDLPEKARGLADWAVESAGRAGGQEIFEFLLARWLDTHVRQISVTPRPLAGLMTVIADMFSRESWMPQSVLDPACGSGGLLLAAARQWAATAERTPGLVLAGTERDLALAPLAAARLGFVSAEYGESAEGGRGTAVPGAYIAGIDVRIGDSLRADPHGEFRADVVLCNPPFGERDWGHEELATDPRWTYGLPPRTEPELAWVEHALARLTPGGVAVLLLPPAVASRRAGRRIRGALLRAGAIRGVIALPTGSAAPYGVSLHLWVLQAPAPTAADDIRREVLMIDATSSGLRRGTGAFGIDGPELHEHVVAGIRSFVARSESNANGRRRGAAVLPEGCIAVPVVDLLDEQVDLTPARYVPDAKVSDGLQLRDSWLHLEDLLKTLGELAELLSRFYLAGDVGTVVMTTVGDLDRAQALTVHAGREAPAELIRLEDPSEGAVPMLTVPDLLTDGKPGSWLPADQVSRAGGALIIAEAGDVVVVGVERAYGAWVQTDGPVALGPQLYRLRVDPALLNPWFIAGCLRAPANARQAGTHTSSSSRIDVRKLQVLQLLLTEQRRYARAFQQLAAMEEALTDVRIVGAGLLRTLSNGLAAGQLRQEAAGSAK